MTAPRPSALLVLLAMACGGPEAEAPVETGPETTAAAAPMVETARVTEGNVASVITASGSIAARRSTEIVPEVAGRLIRVAASVGDEVAEGDELFRIDPEPYEMAVAEARAGLSLARAEAANAREEAERVSRLLAENAASEQRQAQLRTQAAVAAARVEQAEARLARVERDLEQTVVRAPYAGSIVERRAHEGAMAGEVPVLVLQESGALEAILDIPEAASAPLRVGDRVMLRVEGSGAPLETTLRAVARRVDPDTRTYEVRAAVPDPEGLVKAGSYVQAELHPAPGAPVTVVPRKALLQRDGRTHVFRVTGERVERVAVRVGRRDSERVEILGGGVAAGDVLVVGDDVQRLSDGSRVSTRGVQAARTEPAP